MNCKMKNRVALHEVQEHRKIYRHTSQWNV